MNHRWLLIFVAVGAALASPRESWAQSEPYRLAQRGPTQQRAPLNPQLDAEDQLSPGQIERAQERERTPAAAPAGKQAAQKRSAEPARAVACSGLFAKDSGHDKLAAAFKPENVEFATVEAGEGKKIMASVLYPKDPKRRLEVWWRDETNRSGTYLVVIGGQSTWTGPKGVRVGMETPALERLNGKPFRLQGFDSDGVATATDWQGGAFAQLPGDCGVRMSFRPNPKASSEARSAVSSDKEFTSRDAVLRALKPRISEILIGY
jgi:hypothetical protein